MLLQAGHNMLLHASRMNNCQSQFAGLHKMPTSRKRASHSCSVHVLRCLLNTLRKCPVTSISDPTVMHEW
jgi:hypothetical protein